MVANKRMKLLLSIGLVIISLFIDTITELLPFPIITKPYRWVPWMILLVLGMLFIIKPR